MLTNLQNYFACRVTGAVRHRGFLKGRNFNGDRVERINTLHRAKFRGDCLNRC